jgi:acetyl esterase/lipase
VEVHHYGRDRSQFGELFLPARESESAPVAVVVHGGFWRAQHGRKLMHAVCADLAARGWVAWNLEYRRLGRSSGGGYPRTLEDVAAGIDHLADLPHTRLDLSGVVAIGHSAGGHLAAWAATREAPRVPLTGVVAQAGVVDLRMGWELRLSDGVVGDFLGGDPDAMPERLAAASPAERLPLGVPALLTHGARDEVVPLAMSEAFAAAARAAGDEVDLVVEPGEEHMGHVDPGNPLWAAVRAWLRR